MTIIFAGTIGRSGLGGQAWANLQYLLGLRALGHKVVYLEDCGESSWVYDWAKGEWTTSLEYPAAYVRSCLEPFGFRDDWIYRTNEGSVGFPLERLIETCRRADLLIMRAVPLWVWREEYGWPRGRAFIDVDPGFTQISMANGDKGILAGVARCERRFTVGQRIGAPDCPIPLDGGPWLKTRPPVFLEEWPVTDEPATHFTSIMRWQGFREAAHGGASYGQRDKEFPKFICLPAHTAQKFRIALIGTKPETLTPHGWEVAPGEAVSRTPSSYRAFIQGSRGEFSVPKHGYVEARSGWFSDRSVCYLASGRPVAMEDTGLGDWLPAGKGLLTFKDVPTSVTALREIDDDYEGHRRAARLLAENYFATNKVLPALLNAAAG